MFLVKKNIPRYYIYRYLGIFFLPETSACDINKAKYFIWIHREIKNFSGSFQPDQEKACNICPFQRFQYFPKAYSTLIVFYTKDKLKFGAKLISDNFYVSIPDWFLFLHFKYWYSLKRFWDCDFNFVNVLELHQSMEEQ